MKKSYYFLMLLAIVTFFVTCKPKPEPEPEPTYNLTFWTNEDFGGVIVVNLYNNGGYDKEGFISKVYSSTPDCGDNGCATFKDLKPGKYYYSAICGYYEWEAEVNVSETCGLIKLDESNAIIKYNVTFWTNDSDCSDYITVNLYNNSGYDKDDAITKVLSSTPDCGEDGCATFENIEPGKYYYHAINDDFEWEGEINVNDACELVKLDESNAIEKYNVTFWTNDNDCNNITVNLYNSGYDADRTVTKVLYSTPDCKENGCANFEDIEPGYYYYYASNGNFEWEGEVNVTETCKLVKLDESNAIEKEKGRVSFWTDEEYILQVVEVNLWKTGDPSAYDETETITMYYNPGYSPEYCGEEGCANFYDVEYGEYSFYAENDYYSWSGTLTVDYPCELMKLILGKAEVKKNAQPSGRQQIQPIK